MRRVRITNIYELHGEHVVEQEVRDQDPGESDQEYDDYLFSQTGVGFTDGDSSYFMESIDGLEPTIDAEWGV